jgi:hypothetical protein
MRATLLSPLLFTTLSLAANPRLLSSLSEKRDDICQHQTDFREMINGDPAKAKDFWTSINATAVLTDYLITHGARGWANDYLGAPYDCVGQFPNAANCRSPDPNSCPNYNPPVKYYIQTSMSNLYSSFVQWHEALQDTVLAGLSTDIKTITDDWGPPEAESDEILDLVLGALKTLTGFLEPEIAEPIEKIMDVYDLITDATKSKAESDPNAIEKELEAALGDSFKLLNGQIQAGVSQVFDGPTAPDCNSPICQSIHIGMVIDKGAQAKKITDYFEDGAFLDSEIVQKSTAAWIDSMKALIHDGLVVLAWNNSMDSSQPEFARTVLKIWAVSNPISSQPPLHRMLQCCFLLTPMISPVKILVKMIARSSLTLYGTQPT